ncbi:MAG: pyrroline-5-carboxylate reductase [Dehalococcoidia bacterium]
MKIAVIGAGVMGEAIISAVLEHGAAGQGDICACDVDPARLEGVGQRCKVNCTSDINTAISGCEVVILSIKPQSLVGAMSDLKGKLKPEQLVLSIVAGATVDTISKGLAHDRVARVMPNTPAQVGAGMSVWTATDSVDKNQRKEVQIILGAMGKELHVSDEKYIDMATAVSGSGPAYIFLVMEGLIDAGVHIGMPRGMAEELVFQTVLGAAHMTRDTGRHPAELRNAVTSPGGTTAEGLLCLEEGGMRAILAQAVIAAYNKAQVLGSAGTK